MGDSIQLFISHSSGDVVLAERLVTLLQSALPLPASTIRYTSVDGYRLPGGADTDEQLRREVHEAAAFIGIVSDASIRSLYVLFELGARWGAKRHLVPLLAPGTPMSLLGGPLAGLNALRADKAGQLHQLISDLAQVLHLEAERPVVYQRHLEAVLGLPPTPFVPRATTGAQKEPLVDRGSGDDALEILSAISEGAYELLREAGQDKNGLIVMTLTGVGLSVETNGRGFAVSGDPRSEAKWRSVVLELVDRGLLEQQDETGHVFRVTDRGYQIADSQQG